MVNAGVRGFVVFLALAVGLVTVGCSASRTRAQSRSKVLEAEVIDLRQQADVYRTQAADAQARQDEAVARLQEVEYQKGEYERQVDDARETAGSAMARVEAAEYRLNEVEAEKARLAADNARLAKKLEDTPPAPSRPIDTTGYRGPSPELAALQRDLQSRMSARGISMPVEVRTSQDGTRRVAIVIPDAFKSGRATLSENKAAVMAVVGVGRLVQEGYPGSRIMVEGHTDSDPLVKTKGKWGTNENLSLHRANYVAKLLADTGVPSSQIQTTGVGARHPIELGNTKRAKSRNRRVEVFIVP